MIQYKKLQTSGSKDQIGINSNFNCEIARKIIDLDINEFPRPWTENQWNDVFELKLSHSKNNFYFLNIIEDEKDVSGFALFHLSLLDKLAHLLKIIIKKDKRHSGLASDLFLNSLSEIKDLGVNRCYLEVDKDNTAALNFYKKMNFQKLNLSKNFYGQNLHAWTMILDFVQKS